MTTAVAHTGDDQVMVDVKPFKRQKVEISSSPTHTIDLTSSDIEEE